MVETYVERVHTEHALLDIGEDIGALVIHTRAELRGKEIQVSRKGTNAAKMVHTAIWERRFNGRTMFAGIYPTLPMGDYIIWTHPSREVTIFGGSIAEVDLRDISDIYVPDPGHAHGYDQNAPGVCATASREGTRDLLPPRYRDGRAVSAAPMGAAPLRYADDGQVAWDEMWTNFCDLALAGGPSHRGTLLEPVASEEVKANQDAYERVVAGCCERLWWKMCVCGAKAPCCFCLPVQPFAWNRRSRTSLRWLPRPITTGWNTAARE